jgi:hypothetical protein
MSALPPKTDIAQHDRHVRFVPKADIGGRPLDVALLWSQKRTSAHVYVKADIGERIVGTD